MSLTDYNLMTGENIVAEAQFHYFLYWLPAVLVLLAVVLPFLPLQAPTSYMLICSGAILFVALLWIVALNNGKRYILTNKRIIKKTGIIRRETAELMLRKVESVSTRQSIAGRIFGYGDVVVSTGEQTDSFEFILQPHHFSNKIHEQIDLIASSASNSTALARGDE
jgi:uncharacterized membrane protein YdbT with pleckstrin-like domain